MEKDESRIDQLLKVARENSGKILVASGAVTAALLGYHYWPSIKKCYPFRPVLRSLGEVRSERTTYTSPDVVIETPNNDRVVESKLMLIHEDHKVFRYRAKGIEKINVSNDVSGNIDVNTNVKLLNENEEHRLLVEDMKQLRNVDTKEPTYFCFFPSELAEKVRNYVDEPEVIVSVTKKAAHEEGLTYMKYLSRVKDDILEMSFPWVSGYIGIGGPRVALDYELKLPKDYPLNSVDISTHRGNIKALDMPVTDSISAYTKIGDIVVQNKKFARRSTLCTQYGNIKLIAPAFSGKIHLITTNGKIFAPMIPLNVSKGYPVDVISEIGKDTHELELLAAGNITLECPLNH